MSGVPSTLTDSPPGQQLLLPLQSCFYQACKMNVVIRLFIATVILNELSGQQQYVDLKPEQTVNYQINPSLWVKREPSASASLLVSCLSTDKTLVQPPCGTVRVLCALQSLENVLGTGKLAATHR